MAFSSPFSEGWLSTGNQLLSQQGQQLQQALAIADQIAQQDREAQAKQELAYKKEQDRLDREWEKDPLNPKNITAKSMEADRKAREERQKQEDLDRKTSKAFEIGAKYADITPTTGELLGIIKAAGAPSESIDELIKIGLKGYQQKRRGEYEAAPPPQPQPMPAPMQQGVEMMPGMFAAAAGIPFAPQIPGMPQPPQQGGYQPIGPGIPPPPAQGPTLPPIMGTPPRTPYQEPTEEDFLASPNPTYVAAMQKVAMDAQVKKVRADVMMRGMALKEDLDPKRLQAKIDADYNKAETDRIKAETEQTFVDAKIRDMKDKLIRVDRDYRRQIKLDDSLIAFRTAMKNVAEKNAVTRAKTAGENAPKAMLQYTTMLGHAGKADSEALNLENMGAQAKIAFEQKMADWEKSEYVVNNSTDPVVIATANAMLTEAMELRRRYAVIKRDAKRARENAGTLRSLAGQMQKEMSDKGIFSLSNGTTTPPPPRMPAKPQTTMDALAKQLNIP